MSLDLIERLMKRAEIRRQITTRKSVQEGKPDRLADLLDEAAAALSKSLAENVRLGFAVNVKVVENESLKAYIEPLKAAHIELRYLIEKLDEAMTPQAEIDAHTKMVGGFVSSLDLLETAEQIIARAIAKLKEKK